MDVTELIFVFFFKISYKKFPWLISPKFSENSATNSSKRETFNQSKASVVVTKFLRSSNGNEWKEYIIVSLSMHLESSSGLDHGFMATGPTFSKHQIEIVAC